LERCSARNCYRPAQAGAPPPWIAHDTQSGSDSRPRAAAHRSIRWKCVPTSIRPSVTASNGASARATARRARHFPPSTECATDPFHAPASSSFFPNYHHTQQNPIKNPHRRVLPAVQFTARFHQLAARAGSDWRYIAGRKAEETYISRSNRSLHLLEMLDL